MIERLIGPNKWSWTGWRSFKHIKEYNGYFSQTWIEGNYVFIAWSNESGVDIFRQKYTELV